MSDHGAKLLHVLLLLSFKTQWSDRRVWGYRSGQEGAGVGRCDGRRGAPSRHTERGRPGLRSPVPRQEVGRGGGTSTEWFDRTRGRGCRPGPWPVFVPVEEPVCMCPFSCTGEELTQN